jgi:hypothetical protein
MWNEAASRKPISALITAVVIATICWSTWQLYQRLWLSKGERDAARVALREIEKPRPTDPENYEALVASGRSALRAISAAESAAVTRRDRATVIQLYDCEGFVTNAQARMMLSKMSMQDPTPEQLNSMRSLADSISDREDQSRGSCEALHRILD